MKSEISYLVRRAVSRSSSTGPVPHRQRRPVEAVVRRRGSSSGGSSRRRERRSERSNRRGGGSGGAAAVEDCLPRRLCFIFYYCFRIFYIRARSSVCVRERGGGGRTPRTRRGGAREGRDRERARARARESFSSFFFTFDEPDSERVGHLGRSDRSLQGAGRVDVAQEEVLVGQGGGSERAAVVFEVFLRVFEARKRKSES